MRAITPTDSASIKTLHNQSFSSLELFYGAEMEENFLNRRLFSSKLFSTDCSLIEYTDNGDICGAVLANLRPHPEQVNSTNIYLNHLLVSPDASGTICGQQLIAELIASARKLRKNKIVTSLQWAGVWPGILSTHEQCLNICRKTGARLSKGELFIISDIAKTTARVARNARSSIPGVELRPYQDRDFDELHNLLTEQFSVGWLYEVLSKVNNEYESFNGYGIAYTYQPGDVFVALHKSKVCGFCVVQSSTFDNRCFFGPIGIDRQLRNTGIGTRLLLKSLDYLRGKRKKTIGLWTSKPIYERFYKRFGMQKSMETLNAEWSVK